MMSQTAYEKAVSEVLSGRYDGRSPVVLPAFDDAPLMGSGAADGPYLVTAAHIGRGVRAHGVSPETVVALPRLLSEPAALLADPKEQGSLIVILGVANGSGCPFVVVVKPSYHPGFGKLNFIKSFYWASRAGELLSRAISDGTALYLDASAIALLAEGCGIGVAA